MNEMRIDGHGERRVGEAGVRADLGVAKATAAQRGGILFFGHLIVLGDGMGTRIRGCPFLVQPIGNGLVRLLVTAVIAEKNDVTKPVQLEATRGRVENFFEDCIRHGDRSRKLHVRCRRVDAAFRTAFARLPTSKELAASLALLEKVGKRYQAGKASPAEAEQRALAKLCHMLLCANEFLYVD